MSLQQLFVAAMLASAACVLTTGSVRGEEKEPAPIWLVLVGYSTQKENGESNEDHPASSPDFWRAGFGTIFFDRTAKKCRVLTAAHVVEEVLGESANHTRKIYMHGGPLPSLRKQNLYELTWSEKQNRDLREGFDWTILDFQNPSDGVRDAMIDAAAPLCFAPQDTELEKRLFEVSLAWDQKRGSYFVWVSGDYSAAKPNNLTMTKKDGLRFSWLLEGEQKWEVSGVSQAKFKHGDSGSPLLVRVRQKDVVVGIVTNIGVSTSLEKEREVDDGDKASVILLSELRCRDKTEQVKYKDALRSEWDALLNLDETPSVNDAIKKAEERYGAVFYQFLKVWPRDKWVDFAVTKVGTSSFPNDGSTFLRLLLVLTSQEPSNSDRETKALTLLQRGIAATIERRFWGLVPPNRKDVDSVLSLLDCVPNSFALSGELKSALVQLPKQDLSNLPDQILMQISPTGRGT